MKELKRNPQTGIVEVYENGKKVGEIITMGDQIINEGSRQQRRDEERAKKNP